MPGQSNPPRPDGPNDGDDRLGPRVVAVHDPIASLTTLLAKLNALWMELREPRPGLIFDVHQPARDQIAHRLDEIIGGAGDVWPTGARFADVRIIRDGDRFELTLNGVPFPFALNSAEPVTVVQAAGAISTVSLPVLAQSVLVDDRTEQYVAQIGDAVPPVLIEHPFASARADAEPDTADPTVDPLGQSAAALAGGFSADNLPPLPPKWSAPLSMPAPDDDDPRDL